MTKPDTGNFDAELLNADAASASAAIEKAGPEAASLVAAWVKAANAAAVQAVAEGGSGAARKAARRGLNVLKSRGVAIPRTPKVAALVPEASESQRHAWLLPPDNSGVVGIVVARSSAGGSYHVLFAFLGESGGIVRASAGHTSLSKIQESMKNTLDGAGYGPVEVPWAWAAQRIAKHRAWHEEKGRPEPQGLLGVGSLLDAPGDSEATHPFDDEGLQVAESDAVKLTEGSSSLHRLPEFRSWLPSQAAIQELLRGVGQRVGAAQQAAGEDGQPPETDQLLREEIKAATDRYFTPERRAVLSTRMKDAALSVLARHGEGEALRVAAVIEAIREAGLITDPPSSIDFLTAFFDKAVGMVAGQQGGRLQVPIPRAPAAQSPAPQE